MCLAVKLKVAGGEVRFKTAHEIATRRSRQAFAGKHSTDKQANDGMMCLEISRNRPRHLKWYKAPAISLHTGRAITTGLRKGSSMREITLWGVLFTLLQAQTGWCDNARNPARVQGQEWSNRHEGEKDERHDHWQHEEHEHPRFRGNVIIGTPYQTPPVYSPPPVYPQPSQVYIEPGSGYALYCPNPAGYFPAISYCPTKWLQVIPYMAPR